MTHARRAVALTVVALLTAGTSATLGASNAAAAASATATTTVNIRSGPGLGSDVVGGLVRGQRISVLGRANADWVKVRFGRGNAFVAARYLDLAGRAPARSVAMAAAGSKITTATLNVRTGPGLAYRVVGRVADGTSLILTGRLSRGFAETVVAGNRRWVSAQYLAASTAAVRARTTGRRTTAALDVRTSPAARSAVVAEVAKGSVVQTTGATERGYAQVLFENQLRWVTARYLATSRAVFPTVTSAPAPAAGSRGRIALAYAKAQLGKRYVFGAAGPNAFDCSGLVMRAWERAGVSLPRVTTSQFRAGTRISRSQLQPGDLVFYYGSRPSHVAMYVGGNTIIHAPNPRKPVQYSTIGSMPYVGAVRPG